MTAGRLFFGAVRRSRCVWEPIFEKSATRSEKRAEKAGGPARKRAGSLWQLAGVEAEAFGARLGRRHGRAVSLRVAMLAALVVYERRTHPSGRAVCLLQLRPGRVCAGMAGLLVLVGAAGAVSAYACAGLAATITALLLPGAVVAARSVGARARLRRSLPVGAHVYVHSVASTLPGAGAELLREVVAEADRKGWALVLDASNRELAMYYEQFGFVARGEAVKMPDGSDHLRMWRPQPAVGDGK